MKPVLLIAAAFLICFNTKAQPVNVMLVTGGHAYDTLQFFQMFDSFSAVEYRHFSQPEANRQISGGVAGDFDVIVFYDMWAGISEKEKAAYLELTEKGMSLLFLHHSLVSYQNWPEFEKILGGRYIENKNSGKSGQSTYKHDVWVDISIADNTHPVVSGMQDFRLFDEVYGNYRVLPAVKPLLRTTHAESTPVIGWENSYNNSRVIYLQPGHDKHAFESQEYRKLVLQSIMYLAGQKE